MGHWIQQVDFLYTLSARSEMAVKRETHSSNCFQVLATVDIAAVPVLEGAAESIASGILSSLHSQNAQAQRDVVNIAAASQYPMWPLLFDPQTGALSIFSF